ncbi:MAG: hypothetical protein H8D45_28855, partial [Bacteroidetes bacterium]|nr:hypothetical protein [Bacteroidota bacterium]
MQEILRKYLDTLDSSDFDQTHKFDIDKELQKIRDELSNIGEKDNAMLAQLEMEIYSFTKRVEDG